MSNLPINIKNTHQHSIKLDPCISEKAMSISSASSIEAIDEVEDDDEGWEVIQNPQIEAGIKIF